MGKNGFQHALLVLISVGSLGLMGCGDEGPSVDSDGQNICTEIAKVACYNMYECCTEAEIEAQLGVGEPTNEENCRRDIALQCEEGLAPTLWSLDEGLVALNNDAYNSCLEALTAPSDACVAFDSALPWEESCSVDILEGLVAVGGDCMFDFHCAGDAFCGVDRKCKGRAQQGEDCLNDICAEGLFCDFGMMFTCQPLAARGQACTSSNQCQEGLFCNLDAANPTCLDSKPTGEQCAGNEECQSAFCVPGVCDSGNACFEDDDCEGSCEGTGNFCFADTDCMGQCTISGNLCFNDFDCPPSDPCINPACQRTCMGQPSCGENFQVIDFCEDAVGELF